MFRLCTSCACLEISRMVALVVVTNGPHDMLRTVVDAVQSSGQMKILGSEPRMMQGCQYPISRFQLENCDRARTSMVKQCPGFIISGSSFTK